MPIKVGSMGLYFGPAELNQPDNLKQLIIEFINTADDVLHIAVQELDNEDIARSIIDARTRVVNKFDQPFNY